MDGLLENAEVLSILQFVHVQQDQGRLSTPPIRMRQLKMIG
jgi:hypothetical protein